MSSAASRSIGICLIICCIHLMVADTNPIHQSSLSPRRKRRSDDEIVPDLLEDELPENEKNDNAYRGGLAQRLRRAIDSRMLGDNFEREWLDERGRFHLPGTGGLVGFILLTPKKKKIAFCHGYMSAMKYYGNVQVDYGNEHGSSYEQSEDDLEEDDDFGNVYEFGEFGSSDSDGTFEFYYGDDDESTTPEDSTTPEASTTTTTQQTTTSESTTTSEPTTTTQQTTTTTEEPTTTSSTTTTSTTSTTTSTPSTSSSTSTTEGASDSSSSESSSSSSSSSESSDEDSDESEEPPGPGNGGFHQYPNMYPYPGYPPYQQFYYPPPSHGYYPGVHYGPMGYQVPHLNNKHMVHQNNQWQFYDPEKGRVIGGRGRADVDTSKQYYPVSLKKYCSLLLELEM